MKSVSPPAATSSKSTRKCRRCLQTTTPEGSRLACSKDLPVCNECEEADKKCVYTAYGGKEKAKEEQDGEEEQGEGKGKEEEGKSKSSGAKKSTPSVEPETQKSTRKCRGCRGLRLPCSKDKPTCTQCEEADKDCNYEPYGSQISPKKKSGGTQAEGKKIANKQKVVEEDSDIKVDEEEGEQVEE